MIFLTAEDAEDAEGFNASLFFLRVLRVPRG